MQLGRDHGGQWQQFGLGPENVVVKGGHLQSIAADVLYDGCNCTEFRADRVETKNTHGTGCIFAASAVATGLANKKTVRESSVAAAEDFITVAIRAGLAIGKGYGPTNPMVPLYQKAGVDR